MGGKGKKIIQKQKQLKATSQRKREEREIKQKLRKEIARQRNYESNEEKEFAAELMEKGYVIKVIDGDGNCMFRSLSDQMYGTMDRHAEIRQRIVDYMELHRDHFHLFIEDDEPFEDYIERMRTNCEWGGHQELYAASCCYNANIFVYQLQAPRWVIASPDNQDVSSAVAIYLSYHGEYHYNSLQFSGGTKSATEGVICRSIPGGTISDSEKEGKQDQLMATLPWVNATQARLSLESCKYRYHEAVEFAIENFFNDSKGDGCIELEPGNDGTEINCNNISVHNDDDMSITLNSTPASGDASESKSCKKKTKLVRLSKKEKRLLKKDKTVITSSAEPVVSLTSSVGDIVL